MTAPILHRQSLWSSQAASSSMRVVISGTATWLEFGFEPRTFCCGPFLMCDTLSEEFRFADFWIVCVQAKAGLKARSS